MDKRLEEIQAKFDFVQKIDIERVGYLFGDLVDCSSRNYSFEKWYNQNNQNEVRECNRILERESLSVITEEDLKYLYEFMQENLKKSKTKL